MQMAIDEAGRGDGAAAVDQLPSGKALRDLGRLVDGDDPALVHRHRRIADDAALRIDGDQPIDVSDEQIDGLHAGLRLRVSAGLVMRGLTRVAIHRVFAGMAE